MPCASELEACLCAVSEDEILKMVREVSDDKKNDSLEFNEFVKVR